MRPHTGLLLHHEVALLSLKDQEGTVESGAHYRMAMGAAILAELLLAGSVEIEKEKKKSFARVVNDRNLGDPLLDECLQRVATHKKRQQLQTWVSRFAHTKHLNHRVAMELCRKGVLRADEDKVLLLFKRRIYPEVDPKPEREVVTRLKKAIFGAGTVAPRTVTLIAIAQAANLLKNVVEKKRLKERKERIKKITNGEASGKATKQAIEAAQAAAAISVIIAASVVTTTTASR